MIRKLKNLFRKKKKNFEDMIHNLVLDQLAMNCPPPLFPKKIIVDSIQRRCFKINISS